MLKVIGTDENAPGSYSTKYGFIIKDTAVILFRDIASNVSLSFGGAKIERQFTPIYFGGMKGSDLRLA